MKFLTPVAPRWYARLNEATLVTGFLILAGYMALELVFTQLQNDLPLRITPLAAVLAGLCVLYGAIGYRVLSKRLSLLAGLLSFLLLTSSVGSLVLATGGFESQYLLLWVVVIIFSGMFGWLMLGSVWLATHLYFALVLTGNADTMADPGSLISNVIALELPFLISFFLWYGQSEQTADDAQLNGEVGTSDISQGMLINSIAEGVTVIDEQGRIQVFNPAASTVTGWQSQDTKGIDYRSILTLTDDKGQDLPANQHPVSQVFSTGQTVANGDMYLKTRNNKQIELSFVASPVTNKNGGVTAVVAVFRDVSQERLQERQRAEFISTASHEMRTPVAAIEGYLALALNDNVSKIDSKARQYLDKAHASTQHLGKLFQDLLTAAKSEDGRLQNEPKVTEVGAYLDQLVEDIKFAAEKKGLIMEYESGASDNAVSGGQALRPLYYSHFDPERIREVITNIFDNAVKYTPEGKVIVKLAADDEHIVVSVSDTGLGIAQEDLPHLFQKFYRVDSSATRQIGGNGLGLFISRKIVEMNNGKIWVESEIGKGSTFHISLPRLSQDKASQLMKQEAVSDSPLAHVSQAAQL
ncbi:MAG TPA: ATP-binding protein [Candidatus Saccharimonadales bacterium]